jgi:cell division protease FtsH
VIDGNFQRARQILTTSLDRLHTMAEALMKYETIDEEQLKDIMAGRTPRPPRDWDDSTPAPVTKPQEKPGPAIGTPAGQH